MKIMVLGAGALGSLVGGLLSTGHEVTLISRPSHVDAINSEGLRVTGLIERTFYPRAVADDKEVGVQDVIFITVKAYDTVEALRSIKHAVDRNTTVVSLQNGLRNGGLLTNEYKNRSVIALTAMGATMLGPGRVKYAGEGDTVLGSLATNSERIDLVRRILAEAGMNCRVVSDINSEVWMKAIINACINPITALVRKENGCIDQSPPLKDLAREVCREASSVAAAKGIVLPVSDPFEKVMDVVKRTSNNRSSMLRDVELGKRTEIDEITGEIVKEGERFGLDMSHNRTLWSLVLNVQGACF